MITKLIREELIDPHIYDMIQFELLSYYYGFNPTEINEMDVNTFNWYMSFAIYRAENKDIRGLK